jgi:preprotein translocase subunit SecG
MTGLLFILVVIAIIITGFVMVAKDARGDYSKHKGRKDRKKL